MPEAQENEAIKSLPLSLTKTIPYLTVSNIKETVKFYEEKLGFTVHGIYGTQHASVSLGTDAACNVYFCQVEEKDTEKFKNSNRSHVMFMVNPKPEDKKDAVDALAAVFVSNGAELAEKCEDKWWGYRQFTVKDPDGHRLDFFQHGPPMRMPTTEEKNQS